jgi:hypothetical protein
MLDYALKLTLTPSAISTDDIAALKAAVTAYFAFVNRIADGLGVELEERFSP